MTAAVLHDAVIDEFRARLQAAGFEGDMEFSLGAREVASTDNSIYQVRPRAIVYPRTGSDVNRIVRAAADVEGAVIELCPRGGNTGTNGQSLSEGVIVDFARYMTRVLALDVDAAGGTVLVEPGVVLDQLNALLANHGLFFPPMVSTASRATIGGMIATDASGKGSRRYGKTSDYVEELEVVLANGDDWTAAAMPIGEARTLGARADVIGDIHREAMRIVTDHREEIGRVFPKMNRGLTGYNLEKTIDINADRFSLTPILSGSEGTLAITKAARLRVIPIPSTKALAVLRYASFDGGLRDVERLLATDPVAVEILDDNVVKVARTDIIWNGISEVLGENRDVPVRAISFVEYSGSPDEVANGLGRLEEAASQSAPSLIDSKIVRDPGLIRRLWTLREKAVGLLARLGGGRQGIPFVEDTAVPPDRLADYVSDFRALLDAHGMTYGMFGHADVGCLHVRPFLDLKDPQQASVIRPVSDGVAKLTKSYGGLLWGEHGRGFRGEYSPFFFGETLYPELVALKRAFDPLNMLNPGKLASSDPRRQVDRIDQIPLRGEHDRLIGEREMQAFDRAVACNGNGACFSWDQLDLMCPSYKATRDRAQSPKGRAALLRGWARATAEGKDEEAAQLEAAAAASLSTCLSCKACTTLCPVNVDVPTMKSRFLERYYSRRRRPIRHLLLAQLEPLLTFGRRVPRLSNLVAHNPLSEKVERLLGFVDLPRFAPSPRGATDRIRVTHEGNAADASAPLCDVLLVEDSFTSTFEGSLVEAAHTLLTALGYRVRRLPARANGKALYVLGLRNRFAKIARDQADSLKHFSDRGWRLVGLDAATSLMFEQEYREFAPHAPIVSGIEQLLIEDIAAGRLKGGIASSPAAFRLFGHCSEQALRPQALDNWRTIFAHFGLECEAVRTGCCGMAGMFGHEVEHQSISKRLYDLSWRERIEHAPTIALATGFSCRCQVKRLSGDIILHPLGALLGAVQAAYNTGDNTPEGKDCHLD
ncbi:MAG: FAD-binding and (Fe-S)-binding domain-containing protein [Sphingobium sp.]|uniref:FAD-binding and (Fe-S)-binding domain-containing protein n=1 Tax=Sphingobium sp. TaxID=1912891 RepID=UPI0029BF754D|nr:FAD-binding and (Fe-S)-binding domain-containing protein [Sphingobium sp.]MDX3911569.1 FAD-binding and (Fe-S)-binding domain-containing protein [Sphingobium sp.]